MINHGFMVAEQSPGPRTKKRETRNKHKYTNQFDTKSVKVNNVILTKLMTTFFCIREECQPAQSESDHYLDLIFLKNAFKMHGILDGLIVIVILSTQPTESWLKDWDK